MKIKKILLVIGSFAAFGAGVAIAAIDRSLRKFEERRLVERDIQIMEGEGGIVLD